LSPHAYLKPPGGPVVGTVIWAEPRVVQYDGGERVEVLFEGLIRDEKVAEKIRKKVYSKVSVGTFYDPAKSKLVNGFALGDIWFHELVILKEGELPGDPEAYIEEKTWERQVVRVGEKRGKVRRKIRGKRRKRIVFEPHIEVKPTITLPPQTINVNMPETKPPSVTVKPEIRVEAPKQPNVTVQAEVKMPRRIQKTAKRQFIKEEGEIVGESAVTTEVYE